MDALHVHTTRWSGGGDTFSCVGAVHVSTVCVSCMFSLGVCGIWASLCVCGIYGVYWSSVMWSLILPDLQERYLPPDCLRGATSSSAPAGGGEISGGSTIREDPNTRACRVGNPEGAFWRSLVHVFVAFSVCRADNLFLCPVGGSDAMQHRDGG